MPCHYKGKNIQIVSPELSYLCKKVDNSLYEVTVLTSLANDSKCTRGHNDNNVKMQNL